MFDLRQTREILLSLARWASGKMLVYVDPFIMRNERDIGSIMRDVAILKNSGTNISVVCQTGTIRDLMQHLLWQNERSRPEVYEVENEEEFVELLRRLDIVKLFLLCEGDGIFDKGNLVPEMTEKEARLFLENGITGDVGMKLMLAARSCEVGVSRVHLINCKRREAFFQELLTGKGCGTMIYSGGTLYKTVRPATEDDVDEISRMIRSSAGKKVLESNISELIPKFIVFSVDGYVHATAMIDHTLQETSVVEYLVSSESFETSEAFSEILYCAIEEARERKKKDLVIMAENAPAIIGIQPWFIGLGFKSEHIEGNIPRPVWRKCL